MDFRCYLSCALAALLLWLPTTPSHAADQVRTTAGLLEGAASADGMIRVFKGVPYAAPPVGPLRWKPPQPAIPWNGVRQAKAFGPHAVQGSEFSGIFVFRDPGPSEDCLTLNLWIPANGSPDQLPVMIWIHGGSFKRGGSSQALYDGEALARKGVLVVTFNYRLGAFGFLAHPELSKESTYGASGNYGLMDQIAVLKWVKENIAAFGGDPGRVTIFGESAGATAVCMLMVSPQAQGLFQRAIGESGTALFSQEDGALGMSSPVRLEAAGVAFASALGVTTLAEMRLKSAEEVLAAAGKPESIDFVPILDGQVLPTNSQASLSVMAETFAAGRQSHVPLLAGWNSDEGLFGDAMGKTEPTAQNYLELMRRQYGDRAEALLKLYPVGDEAQTTRSILDFATDQYIALCTWKWIDLHARTGDASVYRYLFEEAPPPNPKRPGAKGAFHGAEIEFVFGTLPTAELPWRPEAFRLSELMMSYWTNFARRGDPNGPGLPEWPAYGGESGYQVMHLSEKPQAVPDPHRARYEFLDTLPPPRQ
jgi:para-nitrobenzyl esterase